MRGVWILGTSRSGTSMTSGLFALHGVFFGACTQADEHNPKGYFENEWLIAEINRGRPREMWPATYWDALRCEGWDGCAPWGAKTSPVAWHHFVRAAEPNVIVLCERPLEQIAASWRRHPTLCEQNVHAAVENNRDVMAEIRGTASCPVVDVWTPRLAQGCTAQIERAFEVLGLRFDADAASRWIDGSLWHGGRA